MAETEPADCRVRDAVPSDAEAMASIFDFHVLHGTASFETVPPSAEAMRDKVAAHGAAGWPFVVAEAQDGQVVGYAHAGQFRPRPAYAFACEDSVYVAPDWVGRGVGRALLAALLVRAERAGFRQMVAVIGGGEPASVALHAALGFREMGRLHAVGRKHGRWLDTVYMQRQLGRGTATPPEGEEIA